MSKVTLVLSDYPKFMDEFWTYSRKHKYDSIWVALPAYLHTIGYKTAELQENYGTYGRCVMDAHEYTHFLLRFS